MLLDDLPNVALADSSVVSIDAGEVIGALCLFAVPIILFAAPAHIHVRRVRSAVDGDQVV